MPTLHKPRSGSLQFWPRKRSKKVLPSVNWKNPSFSKFPDQGKLLGFISYKAGMLSAIVKDNTPNSMTKGKNISIPATILECPPVKIYSIRFYKHGIVKNEILASNIDKELKRKLKLPKNYSKKISDIKVEDYDDLRILIYSIVKKTSIKKKPDLSEIALSGNLEIKLKFIKENLNKEINFSDFIKNLSLLDIHGVTIGKGTQGPVKRFGIKLKVSKSEKGRRRPGTLGPWNPSRVTFRVPMAGQTGFFTRINNNLRVLSFGAIKEKDINLKSGFKHYGFIKTEYLVVKGSVPGQKKRQLLLTIPVRKTKKTEKQNYELIKLV